MQPPVQPPSQGHVQGQVQADAQALAASMVDAAWEAGRVELVALAEEYREGLRACCDPQDPVWQIYPYNMSGPAFDPLFDAACKAADRQTMIVLRDGVVCGTSSFMNIAADRHVLEIGASFLAQSARGTGLNGRLKRLMLDRAFACGFRRVEFRVDERNGRSQAAVLKLGAVKEGVLRADRVTWTGHIRDTGVFSILAGEWGEA